MPYQLETGVRNAPVKAVFYGPEGIGKSTLGAQMPGAVFIDIEGGTNQLPVARMPRPTSWAMLMDEIRAVRDGEVPGCSTLVIDTVDAAEALCRAHVTAKNGWENIETPGFGKGFTVLAAEFGRLLDLLSEVTERGTSAVLLGHSIIGNVTRPDESTYTVFTLNLTDRKNASTNAMTKAWADMLLFLDWKVYVTTDKTGKGRASGGARIIRTTHGAAWDAKNRFGLPDEMPLDDASAATIAGLIAGGEALHATVPDGMGQQTPQETTVPPLPENVGQTADAAQNDRNQAPQAATAASEAPAVPEIRAVAYPERLSALADLMRANGVTDDELRRAVASKGYKPVECAVEDWEQGFADWLVSVWPSFMEQVEVLRIQPPFDADGE